MTTQEAPRSIVPRRRHRAVASRPGHGGKVEVALVHRPRYDDWSLPKGKVEPGETLPACAVRETWEETGFRPVLGRPLGEVDYRLTAPSAGPQGGHLLRGPRRRRRVPANDEVDELRWLRPAAAQEL